MGRGAGRERPGGQAGERPGGEARERPGGQAGERPGGQAGERAGERWANAAQAAQAARAARAVLRQVAAQLRDRALPPWDRLANASAPAVLAVLAQYPLRDMITRSARYPVIVHRQRALFGAWYEFFPRSEGVEIDPMGHRERCARSRPSSGTGRCRRGTGSPPRRPRPCWPS